MNQWSLWQFVRSESTERSADNPSVTLVHLRDVPDDEVELVRAAIGLAGAMNGHYLVGPFIESANRVRSVVDYIREQPGTRSMEIQAQLELSMALDEWLVSATSLRRRVEREVGRCLGNAAAERVKVRFKDLYDNDVEFRLVWEWRNAAQHTVNPVAITGMTSLRVGDEVRSEWVIDGARAAACGFSWPPAVLAHMTPALDGNAVMGRVIETCNKVLSEIMVENDEALENAATLLLGIFAEQQDDKPGARVLARMDRNADQYQWDWLAVRWDLPGHLIAQLESARAFLGLPRKWSDIEL